MTWLEFWGRPHAIYANQRNLDAHFERLAHDLEHHLPADASARVIDWGCGDALAAGRMANRVGTLFLYDAVEAVRERLGQRYGARDNIRILDQAGLAAVPDGSIDRIIVISVLQYLDAGQLRDALSDWHRLLRPQGELLVADVIDPATSPFQDVASQLRFAASEGFLGAALMGLGKLALSDYARIRKRAGFSTYRREDMLGLLRAAGFEAAALDRNIGPTPHRHAFLATKPGGSRRLAGQDMAAARDGLPSLGAPAPKAESVAPR